MAESFLIALREGFEAALIVAIVLAFVRRQAPQQARAVWVGTAAAVVLAVVVGLVLSTTLGGLDGAPRQRTFAAIGIAAAGLLTWMIFWMRTHARGMRGDLEGKAGVALATGSSLGLALVAFAAVAREGLETALFLLSITGSADGGAVVLGTGLGLALAAGLGVLVYRGSRRLDMRRFFLITGALIVLFAAGLLARSVGLLQGVGDLGTANDAVYDLTGYSWLTEDSQSGRFLTGIFGWDPRPSLEQVFGYLAFAVPVGILFFRGSRPARTPVAASALQ